MTQTATQPREQVLVATDFGYGDLDRLLGRIVGAMTGHTSAEVPDPRRGASPSATVIEYRFRFDRDVMRNTVAHGHGCSAGFVCHVEDVDEQ